MNQYTQILIRTTYTLQLQMQIMMHAILVLIKTVLMRTVLTQAVKIDDLRYDMLETKFIFVEINLFVLMIKLLNFVNI